VADVILPVLDEAEALPWVLERIPSGFDPMVVDNGSTDGSAAVAARLGAQVITEPRRGFGAACFAGLVAAEAPIVCFMDADGSLDPCELRRVVLPVLDGEADLVLGARRPTTPGAWPAHARLANAVLARELRRRTGMRLHDIGPMRAARRDPLLALGLLDRRFGWPLEMVLRAARAGWRIHEVEVSYLPRRGGRSKVSGSLRGSLRAVRDMAAALGEVPR
jgi:glycosyltransferase involved in cell wall biosynthesis